MDALDWHDAVARAHDCALQYRRGPAVPSSVSSSTQGPTISDAMLIWCDYMVNRRRWKPSSNRVEKVQIFTRNFLTPRFPHQRCDEIPPLELAKLISEIYDSHSLTYARDARSFLVRGLGIMEALGHSQKSIAQAAKVQKLVKQLAPAEVHEIIHRPSLPVAEMSLFMQQLHHMPGMAARALEILILTACRVRPVVRMQWRHVDLNQGIWICPRDEMKNADNGQCIVQLSTQALDILRTLHEEERSEITPSKFVFHAKRRDRPICLDLRHVIHRMNSERDRLGLISWTDPEISRCLEKNAYITPHGFRATFRTWATSEDQSQTYPIAAIERCLHHRTKDHLETCYDRNYYPRQQRKVLQDWADFCFSFNELQQKR